MPHICPACGRPRKAPEDIEESERHTRKDGSECHHKRFGVAVPALEVAEEDVPDGIAYFSEEWDHGLTCSSCNQHLKDGMRYSSRIVGVTDGILVSELVCMLCVETSPKRHAWGWE